MHKNVSANIEGVIVTPLKIISDDRGAVLHMLRNDSEGYSKFGECYFSEVLPGKIKAWKRHTIQTQNFAVPIGTMRVVIFDDRPGSPSRSQIMEVDLGRPHAYSRITIPPLLWYGFKCISKETALLSNCADYPHDKAESETIDLHDPLIPYSWE